MTDQPPDDVLEELGRTERAVTTVEPTTVAAVYERLLGIGDLVRATVPEIHLQPVAKMSPEARQEIAQVRTVLDHLIGDLALWRDAIDVSFRRAAIAKGQKQIRLADGSVKVEPARNEYIIAEPEKLRDELYGQPELSREEVDSIFTLKTELVPNNSKLNYYRDNRGEEVAAIIDQHRVQKLGDPLRSRLTYLVGDRRVKRA